MSNRQRHYTLIDELIIQFDKLVNIADKGARVCLHPETPVGSRPLPNIEIESPIFPLSESEKQESIALMRINHTGEVCAQALYEAQALTARDPVLSEKFKEAAQEEQDHLNWCSTRLKELDGRTSYLNPIWFFGSFGIGLLAGLAGDKVSLGFLAETEHQVARHLESHLEKLPIHDKQSRSIVKQMHEDELSHATKALEAGGVELPGLIRSLMTATAKIMTFTARFV